jgi:enoyl-CoA hydratase/carnithine racemase
MARNPEGSVLVFDIEGTDSKERGEQRMTFEQTTSLFALAIADCLLINMWTTDIGRYGASNLGLLKVIFEVNLKLFGQSSAKKLLFVLRDFDDRGNNFDRIRTITLNRPDALNAFNEALYDATTDALIDAAADNSVAVVIITGTGRSFSAGTDVVEMAMRNTGGIENGRHGFPGLVDNLVDFPKPLICAVNGMALGIGATMLALSDLVFMSTDARVRCPFTALAVAPEAASSYTFPALIGRHNATWALMSSEWLSAQECLEMGITWKVCEPDALMEDTMKHARGTSKLFSCAGREGER